MTHGSLFSGIGGFDLAAQWMGWENVFHCELNPFGRKVLNHYWPNSKSYEDITKTDFSIWRGKVDIITGGFPCQPFSQAGKRKGTEDARHLWPRMLEVIRDVRPSFVVGENVYGLVNWDGGMVFDQVHTDLENEGYQVQAVILPASAVGAPHRRDRVWFVAYSDGAKQANDKRADREEKGEVRGDEKGDVLRELFGNGYATYSNSSTARPPRKGSQVKSNGRENNDEQERGREQAEQYIGCCEFLWYATNAENKRLWSGQGVEQQRAISRQERAEVWCRTKAINQEQFTSHSDGKRQPRKEHRKQESRRLAEKSAPNDWDSFPTQSPICGGNDGLPSRLDGITFPKWRNESIKAYGNAIVPQVAYEIFKAIEKTI